MHDTMAVQGGHSASHLTRCRKNSRQVDRAVNVGGLVAQPAAVTRVLVMAKKRSEKDKRTKSEQSVE